MNGLEKSGLLSTGEEHIQLFNSAKAPSHAGVHLTRLGAFFRVKSVKGAAIVAKSGMNFRVVASKSKEGTHVPFRSWGCECRDGLDLWRLWSDSTAPNKVTQIPTLFHSKLVLSCLHCQPSALQALQNLADMGEVLLPSATVNHQVIKVCGCKFFHPTGYPVHHSLKGSRGPLLPKRHDIKLE